MFVCCINRGVLARALALENRPSQNHALVSFLSALMRATGLGQDTASEPSPRCWPLDLDPDNPLFGLVACWPMDMESLLLEESGRDLASNPVDFILSYAASTNGRLTATAPIVATSRFLCPLRQNAEWLRTDPVQWSIANDSPPQRACNRATVELSKYFCADGRIACRRVGRFRRGHPSLPVGPSRGWQNHL